MVRPKKPIDSQLVKSAKRARAAYEIARIDYLRAMRQALETMSQAQVAEEIGVTQPAISQLARSFDSCGVAPDGFTSASATETLLRFCAGAITKNVAIAEIQQWKALGVDVVESVKKDAKGYLLQSSRVQSFLESIEQL